MSQLTEVPRLLDAIAEEHARLGQPLHPYLRPGRPAEEVMTGLAGLGLTAPEELTDLFGWADGIDHARWTSASNGAPTRTLVWPMWQLDLASAVTTCRAARQDSYVVAAPPASPSTGYWMQDWLPFLAGGAEWYVVQCRPDPAPSPVWFATDIPGDDCPTRQRAETLTAFLASILDLFQAGAWRWDTQARALVPVDEVFAARSLASGRP